MIKHPAKFSDGFLEIFNRFLVGRVLDPFAGTGKLKEIRPKCILVEMEREWAKDGIVGDALNLPFRNNTFDSICTSPTYGNRMADNFECKKGYKRNTYRHCLGKELKDGNSGKMQWGQKYKEFHKDAWVECKRVLKPDGIFVLNISDHIRNGKQMYVSQWHLDTFLHLEFELVEHIKVETKRFGYGANRNARVPYENIFVLKSY